MIIRLNLLLIHSFIHSSLISGYPFPHFCKWDCPLVFVSYSQFYLLRLLGFYFSFLGLVGWRVFWSHSYWPREKREGCPGWGTTPRLGKWGVESWEGVQRARIQRCSGGQLHAGGECVLHKQPTLRLVAFCEVLQNSATLFRRLEQEKTVAAGKLIVALHFPFRAFFQ